VSQVYVGMDMNSDLHVTQLLSYCDWSKQNKYKCGTYVGNHSQTLYVTVMLEDRTVKQ